MLDWNDLRYFLAVARTGSTLSAGRSLRVSQTTVARRVSALEQALGLVLFDRLQSGYVLTPAGEALVPQAEQVEGAIAVFGDSAAGQARDLKGTVRLTTQEIYAITVLAPLLRDLHELHPDIRIELDTSDELRDLASGGADIALRTEIQPSGAGLVGRKIAADSWTVYCSKSYAAKHGKPRRPRDLQGHTLIGGGGEGVWRIYGAWLRQHALEESVVIHHDSPTGLLSAVRSGFGIAVLPCFIADGESDLIRCMPPVHGEERGLWLMTHERLRHTPRVRAVLDFLGERLQHAARASLSALV